jgi:hypothetical protein
LGIATPLPKKNAQKRFGGPAGESAFAIASSQGKANDNPAPRRNVRRSRCHEGRRRGQIRFSVIHRSRPFILQLKTAAGSDPIDSSLRKGADIY